MSKEKKSQETFRKMLTTLLEVAIDEEAWEIDLAAMPVLVTIIMNEIKKVEIASMCFKDGLSPEDAAKVMKKILDKQK